MRHSPNACHLLLYVASLPNHTNRPPGPEPRIIQGRRLATRPASACSIRPRREGSTSVSAIDYSAAASFGTFPHAWTSRNVLWYVAPAPMSVNRSEQRLLTVPNTASASGR
jgi:hypothetical protein